MYWLKKIGFLLLLIFPVWLFFIDGSGVFLKHADYSFPLEPGLFLQRHVYLWSYQSGAIGVDSTIRFFARLPFLVFFEIVGNNVAFSYFFAFVNTLLIYLSGYVFTRFYLEVKEGYWRHLLSLFLVFNPVFLGNYSKLGLLFASAVLLFLMTATKYLFRVRADKEFWALSVAIIFLLNFSFVHPFNFLLNALIFILLFAYYGVQNQDWIRRNLRRLGLVTALGLAANLYLAVSILVTGSLSKEVLSNSIGQTAEQQFLLNVANNKSIFEAFILAKSVFVEYEFFPEDSRLVYLVGIAALYGALGVLFYFRDRALFLSRKTKTLAAAGLFLLLLLISTGGLYDFVATAYTFLYENIPGGWAFRSPLKFQLYLPVVFLVLCSLLLNSLARQKLMIKRLAAALFLVGVVFSSSHLLTQIGRELLTPKSFQAEALGSLNYEDFRNRRVLYINSEHCRENKKLHPAEYTLLTHYFKSRENTFTVLNDPDYEERAGLYASFDFVVRCETEPLAVEGYAEYYANAEYDYSIWRNEEFLPVTLDRQTVQTKSRFLNAAETEVLATYGVKDYVYLEDVNEVNNEGLLWLGADVFYDIYDDTGEQAEIDQTPEGGFFFNFNYPDLRSNWDGENLRVYVEGSVTLNPEEFAPTEIYNGPVTASEITLNSTLVSLRQGEHKLASLNRDIELIVDEQTYTIPSQLRALNSKIIPDNNPFDLRISDYYTRQINDSRLGFEEGLWTERVGNCFEYDDDPQIAMELEDEIVREGEFSMLLSATRHNACTNLSFEVEPEDVIDLVIPYYAPTLNRFVYQLSFNDPQETIVDGVYRNEKAKSWEEANVRVEVPFGASEATLRLEVPEGFEGVTNTFYFDDLRLSQNPNLASRFLYSEQGLTPQTPLETSLEYQKLSPVKTRFTLQNVSLDEYLLTWQENFHPSWEIVGYAEAPHVRSRGLRNGWVFDVATYCAQKPESCRLLENGNYDLEIEVEFTAQRIYLVSLVVSGIIFAVLAAYLIVYALQRWFAYFRYSCSKK